MDQDAPPAAVVTATLQQRLGVDHSTIVLRDGLPTSPVDPGLFHPLIGTDKARVIVCADYATGLALRDATRHSVAVAFTSSNLPDVVAALRAQLQPEREIVAAVDDDWRHARRAGTNYGQQAGTLAAPHAFVFAPRFTSIDAIEHPDAPLATWAEWIAIHGAEACLEALNEPRGPGPAEAPPQPKPPAPATPARPQRQPEPLPPAEFEPVAEPAEPRAQPPASDTYHAKLRWDALGLVVSDRGVPFPTLDNAVRILEREPSLAGQFWFDEFQNRTYSTWQRPDEPPYEWSDTDDIRLTLWLQRAMGIGKFSTRTAADALAVVAYAHRRNECRDWIRAQVWDGFDRLHNLLPLGFGTERNPYTEAVGRCWLISMVARALAPGCKVDTMPIFEGPQGARKSTALQTLVGARWFAEAAESVLSKDFFQSLQGKLLIEIAEMDSFSRSEIQAVKRVTSCRVDRYRASYGRRSEDHPRACVFAGTTNDDEYLRDPTGARRSWPVLCGEINLTWIENTRAQLFAEAAARFDAGEPWWNVPAEDAKREQAQRQVTDEWARIINDFLIGAPETTVGNVLSGALKIDSDRWDRPSQMRVAAILHGAGWRKKQARRGGQNVKVWVREGGMPEDELL